MSGQPKPPPWVHEELVAIVDGPMAGQWYTATDWTERREAAARMVQRGQRPSACLTYLRSEDTLDHPAVDGVVGTVWYGDPIEAAALEGAWEAGLDPRLAAHPAAEWTAAEAPQPSGTSTAVATAASTGTAREAEAAHDEPDDDGWAW